MDEVLGGLWGALTGSPLPPGRVRLSGSEEVLPGPFRAGAAAATVVAATTLAAAELLLPCAGSARRSSRAGGGGRGASGVGGSGGGDRGRWCGGGHAHSG